MDSLGLCQPATAILLVSVAGILYHLATGDFSTVMWWTLTGLFGTGVFQGLCYGGLEPIAWIVMSIPVLIVCFFLAVALFASKMRIENIMELPCDRCGHKHHKKHPCEPKKPRCNKTRCDECSGCGCDKCLLPKSKPEHCSKCQSRDGGCPYCVEGFSNPNCGSRM